MVKLLALLSNFRTENISTTEVVLSTLWLLVLVANRNVQTQIWKDNFRVFAIDFKRKFNVRYRIMEAESVNVE
jgi:hypothetical protein